MKPIKEMNLSEAKSKLTQSLFTIKENNQDLCLDDAIDDADAALDRIDDLTRWIPVEERMPEQLEVVLCRRVEGGMAGDMEVKPQVGTFRNGSFDCVFDWTRVTHWRRIDKPEGV